jgi:acetyl-CoA acetyltransferase
VLLEVIERAGIPADAVEDVITGCVQQYGEQMFNVGRNAWLQAGLPIETPATTIDRQCGSAQQAVNFGAALIAAGRARRGHRLGRRAHGPRAHGRRLQVDRRRRLPWPPALMEKYNLIPQGLSAEMIADQWEIPRSELDELAVRSHALAQQATEEGRFERETVPFQVNGDTYVADQGIRRARASRRSRAQAGVQGGRQGHRRATRRRSPTAPPAVLLMDAEKAKASGSRPGRGSSTRPRSASTR